MNTVFILLIALFALTTILALAPVLWLIACDFRNHRAIHRLGDGLPIAWRRRADGVLMQASQCPRCGKVTHIHPSERSYRHRVHL